MQCSGLCWAKSRNSIQVPWVSDRGPNTWMILLCHLCSQMGNGIRSEQMALQVMPIRDAGNTGRWLKPLQHSTSHLQRFHFKWSFLGTIVIEPERITTEVWETLTGTVHLEQGFLSLPPKWASHRVLVPGGESSTGVEAKTAAVPWVTQLSGEVSLNGPSFWHYADITVGLRRG